MSESEIWFCRANQNMLAQCTHVRLGISDTNGALQDGKSLVNVADLGRVGSCGWREGWRFLPQ